MLGWIFLVSLSWFQIYSRNVCGEEALNFVTIQSCLFNCQDAHCMQRNMSNILRYIWNICGGKPPSIRGVLIEVAIRWSPNQLTYLPSLIWLLDKYISQFRLIGFSKFTAYGKSHFSQFFWTLPLNGNWNGCIIWIAAAKIPVPVKFRDKSEKTPNESGKVTFSSKIFESLQQNFQFHF